MQRNQIIIVITILIIIAIIALLKIQTTQSTPTVETKVVNEEGDMKSAVIGLYDGYKSCMENPPEEAVGKVSNYCQTNNTYTSENFIGNIEKGGVAAAGGDPITCGQNPPLRVSVGTVNPSQQTAEVIESFGEAIETKVKVALIKEGSAWKIDNIICPIP
jgi:hypothetical protein